MPGMCRGFDELVAEINARGNDPGAIIAVEGASGAGKTTVARRLARHLGGTKVSSDTFYREGVRGARYQDGLRFNDLRSAISSATGNGPVVVDGICLRDTLEVVRAEATVFVYCKRVSASGVWNDDPEFPIEVDRGGVTTGELIHRWSLEYHRRVRPHEVADLIYRWSKKQEP